MATHFLLHYGPWEDMVSAVHRILFILTHLIVVIMMMLIMTMMLMTR